MAFAANDTDRTLDVSQGQVTENGLGFNRLMQHTGQIVLPVSGSLVFFLGVHLVSLPLH